MKRSEFTDSQIMDALKRVEAGLSVKEICREMAISTPTFYKWREKSGGMDVALLTRMKELEAENARLEKRYADERLKSDSLQEALRKTNRAISPA
jgi:putative transposase